MMGRMISPSARVGVPSRTPGEGGPLEEVPPQAGPGAPAGSRARRLGQLAGEPSAWLALAVLLLPLGVPRGPADPSVTPTDALLVVAAGVAGLQVLRGRRLEVVRSVPAAALLLVVSLTAVVALGAAHFPDSLVGALRFAELFLLTPFAVLVGLRTRRDVTLLLGSVVALAVVQGAYGVVQNLTHTGASIEGQYVRAVGSFGAYNIMALAQLCALALVVCLAWAVVRRGRERVAALVLAAFLAAPLAMALSRGVWVATAMACVVVLSRGRPLRLVAALGGLAAGAAVAVPLLVVTGTAIGRRLSTLVSSLSNPDQSLTDRSELWSAALGMAYDHPWLGVGPRAFAIYRDGYSGVAVQASSDIAIGADFQQVALESPHNFYLLVASEQGLLVAFAYVAVLVTLLARGARRTARRRSDLSTAVALTGVAALSLQLVIMLTGDLGGPTSIIMALSVGLAAWAAADVDLAPPPTPATGPSGPGTPQLEEARR